MQSIWISSGWDGHSLPFSKESALYNPDGAPTHGKQPFPDMITGRDAHTSAFVEGELLAMGGHDGSNYLATCEIYTASSPGLGRFPKWTEIGAMASTRAFHASASIGRVAYAMGGQGSVTGTPGEYGKASVRTADVLGSVESLSIDEGVWRPCPELPSPRTMLSGAAMNKRVFAVGGRLDKFDFGEVLSEVLAWDPRTKGWQAIAPLSERRYGSAVLAMDDNLFVFGGKDGNVPLSTVEVYDDRKGAWAEGSPMAHERVFAQAVAMGDFIYVVGGHNRTNEVQEVEEWTHRTTRWRRINTIIPYESEAEKELAEQAIRDCRDEIDDCERECLAAEGDRLKIQVMPLLLSRRRQATELKMRIWRGGEPRDSLLGMRHPTAQTVLPQMTVAFLKDRDKIREAERLEAEEIAQHAATGGRRRSTIGLDG